MTSVTAEARRRARCARDPFGSLILLRADDFEAVASDRRFDAFGDWLARMLGLESGPAYDWLSGSVMFLDPPDHTRLRGFVRKEFTPRRVAALHDGILATADQLLDAALPAGEMEFGLAAVAGLVSSSAPGQSGPGNHWSGGREEFHLPATRPMP